MALILPVFLFVAAVLVCLNIGELLLDVIAGFAEGPPMNLVSIVTSALIFVLAAVVFGVVAFFAGLMARAVIIGA